jgi:hypothetical protein
LNNSISIRGRFIRVQGNDPHVSVVGQQRILLFDEHI